jgi:hypothetical protein
MLRRAMIASTSVEYWVPHSQRRTSAFPKVPPEGGEGIFDLRALATLGERESGTARLEDAVVATWDASLEVTRSVRPPEWVRELETRRDETMAEIARRSAK